MSKQAWIDKGYADSYYLFNILKLLKAFGFITQMEFIQAHDKAMMRERRRAPYK